MWTICDRNGKVLFAKFDNEVLEGQIAIEHIYSGEFPEDKELCFNFETEKFYLHENTR